jgi:hypothetical protein
MDSHVPLVPHMYRLSEEKILAESSSSQTISAPMNHVSFYERRLDRSLFLQILHVIQVDRQATFDTEKKYGSNQRAIHYYGDRSVRSLLVSYMPRCLGSKVVAGACKLPSLTLISH